MKHLTLITLLLLSLQLLSGCTMAQKKVYHLKKDSKLRQLNLTVSSLNSKVKTLEEQNRDLQDQVRGFQAISFEKEQIIVKLEDQIADLRVKQDTQTKLFLKHLAEEKIEQSEPIHFTNRNIQKALQLAGFDIGRIDGVIGPQTRAAITAFQEDHDLRPTGIVQGKTWTELKSYLSRAEVTK